MEDEQVIGCGCTGLIAIALLLPTILLGGTFRTEVTYVPPNVTVTPNQTPFKENLSARHWVWGLVKGQQPDLQQVLAKHVRPGEQVTRLTITTRHTWVDGVVLLLTVGIYCPHTVTIQGLVAGK